MSHGPAGHLPGGVSLQQGLGVGPASTKRLTVHTDFTPYIVMPRIFPGKLRSTLNLLTTS